MSDEGPKLFANKPKKSKLKASTPITMASPPSTGAAPPPPPRPTPPPPPPPQKESFVRRYRFLWPLLLAVNFTLGAYVLFRTKSKDKTSSEDDEPVGPTTSTPTSTAMSAGTIQEKTIIQPVIEPVQRPPIPEDQQRELFKWMLEEKRKMKPRNAEEKKHIDEEKAVLKQFIRAKSVPSL